MKIAVIGAGPAGLICAWQLAEQGHEITVLSEEQRQEWADSLAPMIDAFLTDLESKGVSNAREIYAAMKAAAQ